MSKHCTQTEKSSVQWLEDWQRAKTPSERHALRPHLPSTRIEAMGCRFIVHPADNFTELKLWETGKPPEHEATKFLMDALSGRNPVIVDVGANAGAFFLPIHMAGGPETRSIVFEPNPTMRDRLTTNITLNGLSDRVQVFDCAVSDRTGQSVLHFPRSGNLGQGRIDLAYPHKRASTGVDVPVRPLSECLVEAGVSHVDFLKVDVEGFEDRVIVPLLEAEPALKPKMIYFEISHDGIWRYPLLDILAQHGYDLMEKFDANALYVRQD